METGGQTTRLTAPDGYSFVVRTWPPGRPGGPVALIIHGIQSHGGWFEGLAEYLARRGVGVIMPDRRGSGQNAADRGHAGSVDQLLGDLAVCLDHSRDQWACQRLHAVGISWGGKLALALARREPRRVAGVGLVAPGVWPRIDLPISTKLRVALACLTRPRRQFAIPLDDPALFTANPQRQRFIESDPLRLRSVTAAFLWTSAKLDRRARRRVPPGPACRLLLAEHDDIVDNARLVQWFSRAAGPQGKTIVYPGAHHTLEFEPDPEPYRKDLADWILSTTELTTAATPA